jgi:dihydrofolate synthase/folylpolyglutamate synthase
MIDKQLNYLTHLHRFEKIKPGLQTMLSLMQALGNPQTKFPSIHIAGTNGKGSTAAFIASILQQSKCHTGLYTSPHLCSFPERVVIDGQPITDTHLSHLISQVRAAARQAHLTPTFFEFTTALAFLHFAAQNIDIAVIEVGMGGDLDATNVITPLLSIITNVTIDHTEWLGRTKPTIAQHKAGIIKPGIPLITAETDPSICSFFAGRCSHLNSPFYSVSSLLPTTSGQITLDGQSFASSGMINDTYQISLLGPHQITNAATAITAALVLKKSLPAITRQTIHQGLANAKWPGRLDIVSRDPFILLDGAHNDAGIASLSTALHTSHFPPPDTLVVGLKADTNPQPILKKIAPLFRRIVVTEANYNPLPASQLISLFNPHQYSLHAIPDPHQALLFAQQALPPNSLLLVTGSLYLIGDVLVALKKPPCAQSGQ